MNEREKKSCSNILTIKYWIDSYKFDIVNIYSSECPPLCLNQGFCCSVTG